MNNRELFFRHIAQTSPAPIAIEVIKAEGSIWMPGKSVSRPFCRDQRLQYRTPASRVVKAIQKAG
jgi:hypothetical protein